MFLEEKAMLKELNIDTLEKLAELSFQFGPFVFALIFTIWISRWGYKKYNETCKRKDPIASDDEKKTVKNYFRVTTYFGLALVVVSVVWWFHFQEIHHIFAGRIEGLRDYHETLSHALYIRPVHQGAIDVDLPIFHQDHFIVTQRSPFRESQCFDITIIKRDYDRQSPPIIETYEIPYVKEGYVRLKYGIDPQTNEPGLKVISKEPFLSSLELVRSVYALNIGDIIKKSTKIIKAPKQTKNIPDNIEKSQPISIENHIKRLQNERTSVSGKIDALQSLNELPKEKLEKYYATIVNPEPLPLTLLDLTRHTDQTIALKARQFVERHLDLLKYFDIVTEKELLQPAELTKFVLRLDEKTAKLVLDYCGSSKKFPWATKVQAELTSGKIKLTTLIPTASLSGDRYYIEAHWDSENKKTVSCLTSLFYHSLIHNRTMEQEKKIMRGRNKRWVYWYSKQWALNIAKEIESCGAISNFVGL
jgi:hypothetical protein